MATVEEVARNAVPPEELDRVVACRTASLMVMIAGLWFFVSPWAYYGASDTPSAWNAWIVGAIMFLLASARTWRPLHTTIFSWTNAVLAIWVLISPWVFGYTAYTGRFVNSLCVGVFAFPMAMISARNMRSKQRVRHVH
jgi:hypothetical protein